MLYKHTSDPPQVRLRCRNPRCAGKLKITATNPRDAFCCKGCEKQFYTRRCRVCEALFTRKTRRRIVCSRTICRYQFQHHCERFYGSRYPYAPIAHNVARNPIKPGLKIGAKPGRGWRHVAGPEGHEINLQIPPGVPASRANKAFEEYWRKDKWHRAREKLIKRKTPPDNVIGGYQFPGAPTIDLSPTPATPKATARLPIGDGLEIPAFLRRPHQPEPTS